MRVGLLEYFHEVALYKKKTMTTNIHSGASGEIQYCHSGCIKYAKTPLLTLGSERREIQDEGWAGEQVTGSLHVVAFSLLPIEVKFADHDGLLLTPTSVAFAGAERTYHRSPKNAHGQRTIFVGLDSQTAVNACEELGYRPHNNRDPFSFRVGPCPAKGLAMAVMLDRLVFASKERVEPLEFEEHAMQIVEHAINAACHIQTTKTGRNGSKRKQRTMVERALALICHDLAKKWSLAELAGTVGLSPAYLSRNFRLTTGRTLSQCLLLVRMVQALEQLPDRRGSLMALALECGFASQSHMTTAFSRSIGVTPGELVKTSGKSIRDALRSINRHLDHLRA